jgi:hypothetical protein
LSRKGPKVEGRKNRLARAASPMANETEAEKSLCLSRPDVPDGFVINRRMKKKCRP